MKRLIKVVFEYEDGTKEILEGKKLEEWIKRINSALVLSCVHGFEGMEVNNRISLSTLEKMKKVFG